MSSTENKKTVVVVGGGFTGLACATELLAKGYRVVLLERNSWLGGLAAGFKEPGWKSSLEYFYHHWFTTDAAVLEFAKKWSAETDLIFRRPQTVFETSAGKFVPLDSAVSLLCFPDLNLFEKIRMGLVLLYLRTCDSWSSFDKKTAREWCEKHMGKRGFEAIWAPLLLGKFGVKWASKVNMAWLWARLATRSPKLGTFRGGFQSLIDRAEFTLESKGVEIHKGTSDVTLFQHENMRWQVSFGGSQVEADAVVVAASGEALQKICPQLSQEYRSKLERRPSLGAQVVVLSLKNALGKKGNYWYSLRKTPEAPFLAVIEHTQFVPSEEFGGEHLVYIADYLEPDSADWKVDDSALVAKATKTLQKIRKNLTAAEINRHWIFRERFAQPIPLPGAADEQLPIAIAENPGLFHASMSHVYPWDRGTNFALTLGVSAANLVQAYLAENRAI